LKLKGPCNVWFGGGNTVICFILISVYYHVLSRRGRITLSNELYVLKLA
jgi:hypothetical protein